MQDPVSVLRIRGSLAGGELGCDWVLLEVGREPLTGRSQLAELRQLVRRAERVQLLIPATEVLLARAKLPPGVSGAALAYAVEDLTIGEPESQHVILLGSAEAGLSVLAIMDRAGHDSWLAALDAIEANSVEVYDEALLLPWREGEWSLAWDGQEGFLRRGECDAAAVDCAEGSSPPLALRLLIAEASGGGAALPSLAVYPLADFPGAVADIEAWSRALGVKVRLGTPWDWRRAQAGPPLEIKRRRWRLRVPPLRRLRPALWMLCAALLVHGLALALDWSLLAAEQSQLRRQMAARFRTVFPDAVAVADPALQMRRKLAEARHAAAIVDEGDFLPMAEKLSIAMRETAPGTLRGISYDGGRMTLDLAGLDAAALQRLEASLAQAGLRLDQDAAGAPARSGAGGNTLTVRPR